MANQSLCLTTWISRRVVQQPGQSEPVSYYLNFKKGGSAAWLIRACVILPEFQEGWFSSLANQSLPLFSISWFNSLANQSMCNFSCSLWSPGSAAWQIRDFISRSVSQKPGWTAWSIRAGVLLPGFTEEDWFNKSDQSEPVSQYLDFQKPVSPALANQSLCFTTWILRSLLEQPGQSEPVSYYLDFQKIGSTIWPIRACVLLPEFSEDRFFHLSDQSEPVSYYLDFQKNLLLLPGQSEPVFTMWILWRLVQQRLCFNTRFPEKLASVAWPIRACGLSSFPEDWFNRLVNQSLYLTSRIPWNLHLLPSQSEPVLLPIEPGAKAWPIRACGFLPVFSETRFNSLANQSLYLPTWILRSLLQLAGQSEPVSYLHDS